MQQSNIATEGFRSLREGETVEYDVESIADGRAKAINVTGPDGAAPQVRYFGCNQGTHRHESERVRVFYFTPACPHTFLRVHLHEETLQEGGGPCPAVV
jgi:hypothetical protein